MTTRDVGDRVDLRHLVYNSSGVLTDATVVLTVTDPSGAVTTPSVTHTSTGTYDASFTLTLAGTWFWVWTVSGTIVDVEYGSVLAASPAPLTYATLAELKTYLGITDTNADAQLQDALVTASRGVDHYCGRRFFPDSVATARVFVATRVDMVTTDDFQSTSGLIVQVDVGDNGTFGLTINSANYELEPFNNVFDGEPGWPYYRIRSLNYEFVPWNRRQGSVQVTAKWGWAAVPGSVKQATIYLAEEAYRMKDSPFGIVSGDQLGPIRLRPNQRLLAMLDPYRKTGVLVG